MKRYIFFAALLVLSPLVAEAQDADTTGSIAPRAEEEGVEVPMAGENRFKESQVRKRLAEAGYSSIGTLDLDSDGIWRTTAMKNGSLVSVSFDYQGNIVDR